MSSGVRYDRLAGQIDPADRFECRTPGGVSEGRGAQKFGDTTPIPWAVEARGQDYLSPYFAGFRKAISEMIADDRRHGGVGVGYGDRAASGAVQILGRGGVRAQEPMLAQAIDDGQSAIDIAHARAGAELRKDRPRCLQRGDAEKGLHVTAVGPGGAQMRPQDELLAQSDWRRDGKVRHQAVVLRAQIFPHRQVQIGRPPLVGDKAPEPHRGIDIAQTLETVIAAVQQPVGLMVQPAAVVIHAAADAQSVVMPIEAEALHPQRDHVAPADDDQGHGRDAVAVAAVKGRLHRRARCQADVPGGLLLIDGPGGGLLIGRVENALRQRGRGGQEKAESNAKSRWTAH